MEHKEERGDVGNLEPRLGTILQAKPSSTGRLFHRKWKDPNLLGLMMNQRIRVLFEHFKNAPFPPLGKVVGDFPLYDSLMAGTVSSFLNGAKVDLEAIPVPDRETEKTLNCLKKKTRLDSQEAEFLKYAQLLDELREEVTKAINARGSRSPRPLVG